MSDLAHGRRDLREAAMRAVGGGAGRATAAPARHAVQLFPVHQPRVDGEGLRDLPRHFASAACSAPWRRARRNIVRFLGSIDLAARERGWTSDRERLVDRVFAGYRHGVSEPLSPPSKPDIVQWMQDQNPARSNQMLLAWAENSGFLEHVPPRAVVSAMERTVRGSRPASRRRSNCPRRCGSWGNCAAFDLTSNQFEIP